MKRIFLASLVALICATTGWAQHGTNYWTRLDKSHPVITITALASAGPQAAGAEGYRLSLVYDGQFRKLSAEHMEAMEAHGLKNKIQKEYQYELLFLHEEQEVWLPVQTELIEQLQIEVAPQEAVVLYATVLHPLKTSPSGKKTLLVEEFKAH